MMNIHKMNDESNTKWIVNIANKEWRIWHKMKDEYSTTWMKNIKHNEWCVQHKMNATSLTFLFLHFTLWSGDKWLRKTATVLCSASCWSSNCSSNDTTQNFYVTPSLYIMDGSLRLVLVSCRQTVIPDRQSPTTDSRRKDETASSVTLYIR